MSEHKQGCPSPYDYCNCGAPGSVSARQREKELGRALHNVAALQFETAGENSKLRRQVEALRELVKELAAELEEAPTFDWERYPTARDYSKLLERAREALR